LPKLAGSIDDTYIPLTFRPIYRFIGDLTNYGQNAYFWTFWTFSHEGKSRNDTKPFSAGHQDLRVSVVSAGRRDSKNRIFKLKNIFSKKFYF
jgi:hypothetical protein